jgi:hypothetical protein
MRSIRPSASCSCRPRSSPTRRRCCARAGRARPTKPAVDVPPGRGARREAGPASHESDRARFIGRGRSLQAPRRCATRRRCPAAAARCSTRSWRRAASSRWSPSRRR